jgi:hypothetical protein
MRSCCLATLPSPCRLKRSAANTIHNRGRRRKLLEAFKQLKKTHASLSGGEIKKLRNDFYGDIAFDPKSYPNQIGVIILAHDSEPYIAAKLAPELLTASFPIHVFSSKASFVRDRIEQSIVDLAGITSVVRCRLPRHLRSQTCARP